MKALCMGPQPQATTPEQMKRLADLLKAQRAQLPAQGSTTPTSGTRG